MRQARPPRTPTASRAPIPRVCGSPTTRARATRTRSPSPWATHPRPRPSTPQRPAQPGRSATSSTSPDTPPTPQDGTLPASALTWELIHAALPVQLPHPPDTNLRRGGGRLIHGARPRVPLLPRARAHRDRLGRADRHQDHPARPEDRDPDIQLHPGRPAPGRERHTRAPRPSPEPSSRDPRTQCRPSHRRPRARRPTPSRHGPTAARQTHTITAPATNTTYTARFR